jgi:short-subunit dehydrogenase
MPQRKLALITGASAGMGAAFARAYAARGLDVALVARRADRLEALAAELRERHGVDAIVIPADLSRFGVEAEILGVLDEHGREADVLVNDAGFSIPQSFAAVPWSDQRDFLMTLVVSACGLAHGVLPGMTARGSGSIVWVASMAAFSPGAAGHSLYPGAKSLTVKLCQALDAEYRSQGVRVTALCPGFVKTEFAAANNTQHLMDEAPRLFWQSAEHVVEVAIRANEKGRVVVVPGWHNQLAAILLRHLPESWVSAAVRAGSAKYHLKA